MTDFTSSDGHIRIAYEKDLSERIDIFDARGGANMLDGAPWLSSREVSALREFFQHERDTDRGVWRSPTDPTWTAVRRNTSVYFQNEDHERSFHFIPKLEATIKAWAIDLQSLAYEYIEAHPDLKPWKAAKPGEVWVLTVDGREDAYVDRVGQFHPIRPSLVVSIAHDYSRITEGRRIWPEDAS